MEIIQFNAKLAKNSINLLSFEDYKKAIACDLFKIINIDIRNVFIVNKIDLFPVDYDMLKCITNNPIFTIQNMKTCINYNDLIQNVDYRVKIELKCIDNKIPYYENHYYLTISAFMKCIVNSKFASKFSNIMAFYNNQHGFYSDYIKQFSHKKAIITLLKDIEIPIILNEYIHLSENTSYNYVYQDDYIL